MDELQNIMLRERRQRDNITYDSIYMKLQKGRTLGTESGLMVAGVELEKLSAKGQEGTFWGVGNVLCPHGGGGSGTGYVC